MTTHNPDATNPSGWRPAPDDGALLADCALVSEISSALDAFDRGGRAELQGLPRNHPAILADEKACYALIGTFANLIDGVAVSKPATLAGLVAKANALRIAMDRYSPIGQPDIVPESISQHERMAWHFARDVIRLLGDQLPADRLLDEGERLRKH